MEWIPHLKDWLVDYLRLAKDALHIYVALGIYFGSCLAFGWKVRDWRPLACVLAAAIIGEMVDLSINFERRGIFAIRGSAKDILNTLLVPTMILVLARYSSVFDRKDPA